jgi:hypothetical protein
VTPEPEVSKPALRETIPGNTIDKKINTKDEKKEVKSLVAKKLKTIQTIFDHWQSQVLT